MWFLILPLFLLVRSTNECVATVPGGTVTTTTSATVTTTTVATTTTTVAAATTTNLACAGCTLDNPAIEVIRVNDGNKDITSDMLDFDANGCARRTIVCEGNGPGNTVFLTWNGLEPMDAGTTQGETGANTVMDTMICDGTNWILTNNFYGPEEKRPIKQVECTST